MAITDSGTLGGFPAVEECLDHPTKSKEWGCESISQMIVDGKWTDMVCVPTNTIGGVTFEIYRHPYLVIGDTPRLWKSDYKVKTKYSTRFEYDDFHPCYHYAEEIYENFMEGCRNGK